MKRIAIAVSVLALAGCTNLSAVRDVSLRLTVASKNWDDVSGDIAGSCERERTLNPGLTDCVDEVKASAGLVAADDVLRGYFKALLSAATESNFSVQPGLDAATGSVSAIPGIDQGKVKAVSGLIGLLVNLAAEKMREDTLKELIGEGAPATQQILDGLLRQIVVPRLRGRLDAEQSNLSNYFSTAISRLGDPIGSDVPAVCIGSVASKFSSSGFLLAQEYCKRLAVLTKRRSALEDYDASLVSASKALAELQSSKTKLKSKDLAKKLYAIGAELDEKVAAVRKAFG